MYRCHSWVTQRQYCGCPIRNNIITKKNVNIINTVLSVALRSFSSGTSGVGISMPSSPTSSWERGAKMVKNTDTTNQYLEHIRDTHDPTMHIKTIEDELKGTMGKALGKQGEKILANLRGMEQELKDYETLLETLTICNPKVIECAKRYNDFREKAKVARWELLVHRQAIGFIVNNHKHVHEHYPIGNALPVHGDGSKDNSTVPESTEIKVKENNNKEAKQFGDQLDWWQRIGRWR